MKPTVIARPQAAAIHGVRGLDCRAALAVTNLDLLGVEHVRQDGASVNLWTAEKATWMTGEGVQIFRGNGYIHDYPLGRLWRDAKLYQIGAGTSEIRHMLIGRELFAQTC